MVESRCRRRCQQDKLQRNKSIHDVLPSTLPRSFFVKVFVDMKYKDGSTNSDDQITGLLIALLFAGQHTSSITSTWTTLLSTRYSTVVATKVR